MGAIEVQRTPDYQDRAFEAETSSRGLDRDPQTGATSIPILQTTSLPLTLRSALCSLCQQNLAPSTLSGQPDKMTTSRPELPPSKVVSVRF